MNAQQELADAVVEGSAGGGLVKAKVNGQGDLVDLTISPALVEDGDAEDTAQTIADLVLAAVRDANQAAADLQAEKMGPLASGIGALGGPGPGPGPGRPRHARRTRPGQHPADPWCGRLPQPAARRRAARRRPLTTAGSGVRRDRAEPHRRARQAAGRRPEERAAHRVPPARGGQHRCARLASVLVEVTEKVRFCRVCGNVAEEEECRICRTRAATRACHRPLSRSPGALSRKIREFRGRYHVWGGAISPDRRDRAAAAGAWGNRWPGCPTPTSPADPGHGPQPGGRGQPRDLPGLAGQAAWRQIEAPGWPAGCRSAATSSGGPEYSSRAFEHGRLLDV